MYVKKKPRGKLPGPSAYYTQNCGDIWKRVDEKGNDMQNFRLYCCQQHEIAPDQLGKQCIFVVSNQRMGVDEDLIC